MMDDRSGEIKGRCPIRRTKDNSSEDENKSGKPNNCNNFQNDDNDDDINQTCEILDTGSDEIDTDTDSNMKRQSARLAQKKSLPSKSKQLTNNPMPGFDKTFTDQADTSFNTTKNSPYLGTSFIGERNYAPQSQKSSPSKLNQQANNSTQSSERNWKVIIGGVTIAAIAVCYVNYNWTDKCERSVNDLKSEFNEQTEELWKCVNLFMRKEPGVSTLIILHSPDDESTASCLAQQIAKLYACKQFNLGNNFTIINPADVNGPGDHGIVLERYRETVGAVVIKDANLIEAEKAQIFHTMTDTIVQFTNPALYIFTLQSTSTEKPERAARRILQNAWGQLDFNLLDPLLSRVIGHVVPISRETKLPCSPQ